MAISEIILPTDDQVQICEYLKQAQISDQDLVIYEAILVSNDSPFLVPYGGKFRHGKGSGITHLQIARHLTGRGDYGVACGGETIDHFIIDIDCHDPSNTGLRDFHRRLEQVMALFPDAIPIQSSKSGGIHLLQLLAQPEPTRDVHRFTVNRLRNNGLDPAPSKIEIFTHNPVRLPFGNKANFVLDRYTLTRATTCRAEDIWYIHNIGDRRTPAELFDEADRVNNAEPHAGTDSLYTLSAIARESTTRKSTVIELRKFIDRCERFLKTGLEAYGTRYYACSDLIEYYMFHKGYEPDAVCNKVVEWLTSGHNGFSREYNQKPDSVIRTIRGQVDYFVRRGHPRKLFVRGLSRRECRRIFQEKLSYGEDKMAFYMLCWWKKNCGNRRQTRISSRIFWRYGWASTETYTRTRNKIIAVRILDKVAGHRQAEVPGEGDPILYRIRVRFDMDPRNDEFFDLDDAIVALLTPREIRARYTNYRARRLLKKQREMEETGK